MPCMRTSLTSITPSLAASSILLTTSIPIRPITRQPHTTPLLPQHCQQTCLHFCLASQCQLMQQRPDVACLPKRSTITAMPTTSACIAEAITLSIFAQTCPMQPRSALSWLSTHLDRLDWQGSLCFHVFTFVIFSLIYLLVSGLITHDNLANSFQLSLKTHPRAPRHHFTSLWLPSLVTAPGFSLLHDLLQSPLLLYLFHQPRLWSSGNLSCWSLSNLLSASQHPSILSFCLQTPCAHSQHLLLPSDSSVLTPSSWNDFSCSSASIFLLPTPIFLLVTLNLQQEWLWSLHAPLAPLTFNPFLLPFAPLALLHWVAPSPPSLLWTTVPTASSFCIRPALVTPHPIFSFHFLPPQSLSNLKKGRYRPLAPILNTQRAQNSHQVFFTFHISDLTFLVLHSISFILLSLFWLITHLFPHLISTTLQDSQFLSPLISLQTLCSLYSLLNLPYSQWTYCYFHT